ncbi:hypothetical protein [Streptomyces sp. NPDC056405]|uniref:hypothetical protein n=1 Tax=Streptomyces sp. NPDC056405 TaxID=3345811 RepID=UPI0035E1CE23
MSATVPEPGLPPAPAASGSPAERETQGTAERLLGELRRESVRADTKGSVLVAAQGISAAAPVGVLAARGPRPSDPSVPGQVKWWAGIVCFFTSLVSLLMAVVPRYRAVAWQPGAPSPTSPASGARRARGRPSWRRR